MLRLFMKFLSSVLKEQRLLITTVLVGMGMCFVMIINFLYEMHLSSFRKEDIVQINNHVDVYYDDMSDIDHIIEYLKESKNIQKTMIKTETGVGGSDCILVAYAGNMSSLAEYSGMGKKIVSSGDVLHTEDRGLVNIGINPDGKEFGDNIIILNKEYKIKGKLNIGESIQNITIYMTDTDMMELLMETGNKGCVSFWYADGAGAGEIKKIEENLEKISSPLYMTQAKKLDNFDASTVMEELKDIFLTTIIAIVNYMLIYGFMLNKRMKQYGILKLVGVSDVKLTVFMYTEMLMELAITFIISILGFLAYLKLSGKTSYGLSIICGYGTAFMLMLNILIFLIISFKYRKMTPFQFYKVTE